MRKGKLSPRALDIDFDGGLVEEMADHGGVALLRWHRGKAGTVEHTHRVLEDELAAGVYPKREVRGQCGLAAPPAAHGQPADTGIGDGSDGNDLPSFE